MNTKKILAMIVSVAMVVAMIPAFGIVASAAEDDNQLVISANAVAGDGGQPTQAYITLVCAYGTAATSTRAPYISGTSTNVGSSDGMLGSSRTAGISFDISGIQSKVNDGYRVASAELNMNIFGINQNLGSGSWFRIAVYPTDNKAEPTSGNVPAARNDDYSANNLVWTNQLTRTGTQTDVSGMYISSPTTAYVDVKDYVQTAIEDGTGLLSLRLGVPTAGAYIYNLEEIGKEPTLTVKFDAPTTATVIITDGDKTLESIPVDGLFVGDSYTYDVTANRIKTYEGKTYIYKEGTTTIEALAETDNTLTLTYVQDAPDTVAPIDADARIGVAPKLPATVTATSSTSGEMYENLPVVWSENAAPTTSDAYTVEGVLKDFPTVKVTANVTVKTAEDYVIAEYKFDGDMSDSSVNQHEDATVTGNVTYVDGVGGKAVSLPGTSNSAGYITLPDSVTEAIMDAADEGGFTVTMFVNKNSTQNQFLFSMHGTEETAYERAFGLIDAGNLRFEGTPNYAATTPTRKMPTTANRGNVDYSYAAITMTVDYTDGLGTLKIYENNIDVSNPSSGTELINEKIDFTPRDVKEGSLDSLYSFIGLSPYPTDNNYNGYVDNFKVYGTALTADEVAEIATPDASAKISFVTADSSTGVTLPETVTIENIFSNAPISYTDAPAIVHNDTFTTYYAVEPKTVILQKGENAYDMIYSPIEFASANVPAKNSVFKSGDKYYKVVNNTNIVPNPSFETADGEFNITGWYSGTDGKANTTEYPIGHCFDVSDATAGSHSFGSRYGDNWNGLCSILNSFKVEANKTYLFSYDVKRNVDNPNTNASVSIGIAESATAVSGNDGQKTTENISGISNEWTSKSRIVTVGEVTDPYIQFNAYYIGNSTNGGTGAKFLFDNFVLVEVEEVTVPTFTSSLGVDENDNLAIDILFDDPTALVDGVTYGIKVTDLEENPIATETLGEGKVGFTLEANPFRTYMVAVTANDLVGDLIEIDSIYQRVIDEIVSSNYDTDTNKIADKNLKLINTLIKKAIEGDDAKYDEVLVDNEGKLTDLATKAGLSLE